MHGVDKVAAVWYVPVPACAMLACIVDTRGSPPLPCRLLFVRVGTAWSRARLFLLCVALVLLLRCLFTCMTLHDVVTIDACRLQLDAGGWPCFGACSTPLRTAAGCRHHRYATWVVGWWCCTRAIGCACMRVRIALWHAATREYMRRNTQSGVGGATWWCAWGAHVTLP